MTQFNDFALRASAQKLIELEGFQEPTERTICKYYQQICKPDFLSFGGYGKGQSNY